MMHLVYAPNFAQVLFFPMVMQNLGGRGKPGSMVYVKNGELFTKVNLGKSGYHKWVIIPQDRSLS